MVNLATELLIPLSRAHHWLAERGAPVSRSSLYSWARQGLLETIELGATLYTSVEALQRHAERNRTGPGVDAEVRAGAAMTRLEEAGW